MSIASYGTVPPSPDNTIAENLAQIGRRRESVWRIRQVTAVVAPQVQVDVGGGTSVSVPCLASYSGRQVGDKVLIVVTDVGWCVLGRIGADDALAPLAVNPPVSPDDPSEPPPQTVLAYDADPTIDFVLPDPAPPESP